MNHDDEELNAQARENWAYRLRQAFDPERIKWRIGSTNADKTKGLALPYIDARLVMERLDGVVGPFNWQNEFHLLEETARVYCRIGIRVPREGTLISDWVWKGDGAGATDIEGEKGSFSDAFKRAAVHWGIGRYLYDDIPSLWVTTVKRGRSVAIADSEIPRLRHAAIHQEDPITPPMSDHPRPMGVPEPPADRGNEMLGDQDALTHAQPFGESYQPERDGDDPLTKDDLKELNFWPRCFKLKEQHFPMDNNKFVAADQILKAIGVGKANNLKQKHKKDLIAALEMVERDGSLDDWVME